jgi:hypothetical protein
MIDIQSAKIRHINNKISMHVLLPDDFGYTGCGIPIDCSLKDGIGVLVEMGIYRWWDGKITCKKCKEYIMYFKSIIL